MNNLRILAAMLLWTSAAAGEGIVVEDAWVRALPPTQTNTAAYLRVTNTDSTPQEITGVIVELAGRTEIHTSITEDGYVRMQQLPSLAVAPGESVELVPGGKHLMLLDLERMPSPGEDLQLCLIVAAGEQTCVMAPVRKGAPADDNHQHH
ncbi:MAG: copper(I)-binding protein [Alcanivorax sp.]